MAYPRKLRWHDKVYHATLDDISTSSNVSIPIMGDGEMIAWGVTLSATVSGTAAVTVEIDGTADSDAADNLVALNLKTPQIKDCSVQLTSGQNLEFITDGGSSSTSIANFVIVVRET